MRKKKGEIMGEGKKFVLYWSIVFLVVAVIGCTAKTRKEKKESTRPADSIEHIIPLPCCTEGTIKVYAPGEGKVFEYAGEINIKNSGWNGKPIEIEAEIKEEK